MDCPCTGLIWQSFCSGVSSANTWFTDYLSQRMKKSTYPENWSIIAGPIKSEAVWADTFQDTTFIGFKFNGGLKLWSWNSSVVQKGLVIYKVFCWINCSVFDIFRAGPGLELQVCQKSISQKLEMTRRHCCMTAVQTAGKWLSSLTANTRGSYWQAESIVNN